MVILKCSSINTPLVSSVTVAFKGLMFTFPLTVHLMLLIGLLVKSTLQLRSMVSPTMATISLMWSLPSLGLVSSTRSGLSPQLICSHDTEDRDNIKITKFFIILIFSDICYLVFLLQ